MSSQSCTIPEILEKIWHRKSLSSKGGQFNTEKYVGIVRKLSWRELGVLIAKLSKKIQEHNPKWNQSQDIDNRMIHFLTALPITIIYMHSAYPSLVKSHKDIVPVHGKFVRPLFSHLLFALTQVRRYYASGFPAAAHQAFKASSMIATDIPDRSSQEESAFSAEAVVDSFAPLQNRDTEDVSTTNGRRSKRQKRDSYGANYMDLIYCTLSDSRCARTHPYITQLLRACNNMLAIRSLRFNERGYIDPDTLSLSQTLIDMAISSLGSDTNTISKTSNQDSTCVSLERIFAIIRDIIPLIYLEEPSLREEKANKLVEGVSGLCTKIASYFNTIISNNESHDTVSVCSLSRVSCYQWAVLCRGATWLILNSASTEPVTMESIAVASRLAWYQTSRSRIPHQDGPQLSTWLLLESEALATLALNYPIHGNNAPRLFKKPQKPLFTRLDRAQSRLFTEIAHIISKFPDILSQASNNATAISLVSRIIYSCEICMREMQPSNASLGLFEPYRSDDQTVVEVFDAKKCTVEEFMFQPFDKRYMGDVLNEKPNVVQTQDAQRLGSAFPHKSPEPSNLDEQQREALEEQQQERRLIGVFGAMDYLSELVAQSSKQITPTITPPASKMYAACFQMAVTWTHIFSTSARSNARRQERHNQHQQRVKLRQVGESTRPHRSATDWTRLQRLPEVRYASGETCKPLINRFMRKLVGLSIWKLFSSPIQELEQCLVWDNQDNDSGEIKSIRCLCEGLTNTLSKDAFGHLSLLALQIIASSFGVPAHLSAKKLEAMRPPHLQIRARNPRSSEYLMQEMTKIGFCRVLLRLEVLSEFLDTIRSGNMAKGLGPDIRIMQIWFDMIGSVLAHSLFRSSLEFTVDTNGPTLEFTCWWSFAIASSTQCMKTMSMAADSDTADLRLVAAVLCHLTSWYVYLQQDTSSLKTIANTQASGIHQLKDVRFQHFLSILAGFSNPGCKAISALPVVFFLALQLPLTAEIFNGHNEDLVLMVSRDIWGISDHSLQFLGRIMHHGFVRAVWNSQSLFEQYGKVLSIWLSRRGIPGFLSEIVFSDNKEKEENGVAFLDDEADLVPIPDMDDEMQASDDIVGKMLRDSAQLGHGGKRSTTMKDYFTKATQWHLWTGYLTRVRALLLNIVLGPVSNTCSQLGFTWSIKDSEAIACLIDEENVIYRVFSQLVPYRDTLFNEEHAGGEELCDALSRAIKPEAIVAEALFNADKKKSTRIYQSAAFVAPSANMPIVEGHDGGSNSSDAISRLVRMEVLALADDAMQGSKESAFALCFLAWRRRKSIVRNARRLQDSLYKDMRGQLLKLRLSIPLLNKLPEMGASNLDGDGDECSGKYEYSNDNDDDYDRIYLNIAGGSDECGCAGGGVEDIPSSLALLIKTSPVFDAMLTGNFFESQYSSQKQQQPEQNNQRRVELQCNSYMSLKMLIQTFHKLINNSQSAHLDIVLGTMTNHLARYEYSDIIDILEVANYYALHPVVTLILWYITSKVSTLQFPKQKEDVSTLAQMVGYNWDVYYFEEEISNSARKVLVALVLLCITSVNFDDGVIDDVDAFASDAIDMLL